MTLRAQVYQALGTVYDPELDEPITTLGFVGSCVVSGHDVAVRLRLPTPQCAPNFAFLMAADARAAVRALPAVQDVTIELEDHYTGAEINGAVNGGDGFSDAFPGETTGDLETLRRLFQRKALLARQARLCEQMLAASSSADEVSALRVRDLPQTPDTVRIVALRAALGLPHGPDDAALVVGDGTPVAVDELPRFARIARLASLSLEVNGGLCRDLLRARYRDEVVA